MVSSAKRMRGKVFVVIPAYNEEFMIDKVIKDLKKHNYKNIVVVDDGSSDKTYEAASKHKIHVLKHVINLGQGAALKTGIDYALLQGADIIVTFDADGQHQAKEIERMINPIKKKEVEVTLGSRFLSDGSKIPALRRLYLKIGVLVLFVMYGIKLTDSHNGFRAFSRKALQKIELRANRMEHASEIPEQIKKNRIRFKEIPVNIRYTDYSIKHGQKSSNAFKIFFKMILRKFMR